MLGIGRVGQAVSPMQVMSFIALVTPPPLLLYRLFTPCICLFRCLPALRSLAAHPFRMTSAVVWKAAHPNAPRLVSSSSSSSFCCGSSFFLGRLRERKWGTRTTRTTRSNGTRIQMRMVVISVKSIPGIDDSTTKSNEKQKQLYDEVQRYGMDDGFLDYKSTSLGRQQQQQQPIFSSLGMKENTGSGRRIAGKQKASTTESTRRARKRRKRRVPTLKKEAGVVEDWCTYLLLSADSKKTYVGVTNDIRRRLRQHNGELAGGAKSARAGRPWRLVCTVRGFNSRSEACQFEWSWKSTATKIENVAHLDSKVESPLVTRRRATLAQVLISDEKWTRLDVEWHDT